jgi:hypothetical protein
VGIWSAELLGSVYKRQEREREGKNGVFVKGEEKVCAMICMHE